MRAPFGNGPKDPVTGRLLGCNIFNVDMCAAQVGAVIDPDVPVVGDRVIEVCGLHMSYGSLEAVGGIDLDVRKGEVFAFLGPNGAGKTTSVEILEGFRRRTGGEVLVLGEDPANAGSDWRGRIGVVLQESAPEPELSVDECLALYAGYYPRSLPIEETLGLVGLVDRRSARCGQLSGGQRRRLDVALALIGDPELLFLDEPTTGFDPSARRSAGEVICGLRKLGQTIFLTTHYMEEAEYLADRIAVIAKGRIVATGAAASIGERATRASTVRFSLPPTVSSDDLPPVVAVAISTCHDNRVELSSGHPLALLGELAAWAGAHDLDLPDLEVNRPSLEEVYLELTQAGP